MCKIKNLRDMMCSHNNDINPKFQACQRFIKCFNFCNGQSRVLRIQNMLLTISGILRAINLVSNKPTVIHRLSPEPPYDRSNRQFKTSAFGLITFFDYSFLFNISPQMTRKSMSMITVIVFVTMYKVD